MLGGPHGVDDQAQVGCLLCIYHKHCTISLSQSHIWNRTQFTNKNLFLTFIMPLIIHCHIFYWQYAWTSYFVECIMVLIHSIHPGTSYQYRLVPEHPAFDFTFFPWIKPFHSIMYNSIASSPTIVRIIASSIWVLCIHLYHDI